MGSELPKGHNKHHVLFFRRPWESQPDTKELRNNKSLIIPIKRRLHRELHADVLGVPLLHPHIARLTLAQFQIIRPDGSDHIQSVKFLLDALTRVNSDELTLDRDRRLGHLTVESIEAQLPYIEKGILLVEPPTDEELVIRPR